MRTIPTTSNEYKLIDILRTLGYGAKRRAYDPDYEHVESSKYREYERLEGEGYDEAIKDPEENRIRNIKVLYPVTLSKVSNSFCPSYCLITYSVNQGNVLR